MNINNIVFSIACLLTAETVFSSSARDLAIKSLQTSPDWNGSLNMTGKSDNVEMKYLDIHLNKIIGTTAGSYYKVHRSTQNGTTSTDKLKLSWDIEEPIPGELSIILRFYKHGYLNPIKGQEVLYVSIPYNSLRNFGGVLGGFAGLSKMHTSDPKAYYKAKGGEFLETTGFSLTYAGGK